MLDSKATTVTTATGSEPHHQSSRMTSKARRVLGDAERKAAAQLAHDRDTQRVLDPETKVDRTPLPLLKQQGSKGIVKRGADRRISGQDPTTSVSQSRTSRSESEGGSISRALESSNSSDPNSTSTPDEDSTANYFEESSDSHSTFDRSSNATSTYQHKSQVSLDTHSGSDPYRRGGVGGTGKGAEDARSQVSKPKEYTAEERRRWLQRDVTITLTETPTVLLFSRQDEVVSRENVEEAAAVRKKNERYKEFCEARKGGESGGRYTETGITTLNDPCKSIHTETQVPSMKPSGGLQVTTWKLLDEFQRLNEEEAEPEDMGAGQLKGDLDGGGELGSGGDGDAEQNDDGDDGDDDGAPDKIGGAGGAGGDGGVGGGGGAGGAGGGKKHQAWLQSSTLLETVLVVERAVVGNIFEELQLNYRGLVMDPLHDVTKPQQQQQQASPSPGSAARRRDQYGSASTDREEEEQQQRDEREDRDDAGGAPAATAAAASSGAANAQTRSKLKVLWRYTSEETAGKNVSCMAWNRKNTDILATGYGEFGIPSSAGNNTNAYAGLVCCWSLKNPAAPERVIRMESDAGVSAMHFSAQHPSLLAVGNTDGTLALYDVRKHGNAPALKTTVGTGQHTGTIWEVRWVEKGKDRGESLVSISADGHVMEWSIKKGLERTADLMRLKRIPNRNNEAAAGYSRGAQTREALLSRQSGGMCFDMNPREHITYVVGTEDGTVHKCSRSQNENYVLDYAPHAEPVYRIRWSPYSPDYFLTCSADWTSRVYHIDTPDPIIKMDSNRQDAVHDVCWSPANSTIFAAATAHGMVDIWDVADPMQPKASLPLKNRSLNCVLFGDQDAPVLTVGDNHGEITVVKLYGNEFERNGLTDKEQEERLVEKLTS